MTNSSGSSNKCEGCLLDEPTEEFSVNDWNGGDFYTQHGCEHIDDCFPYWDFPEKSLAGEMAKLHHAFKVLVWSIKKEIQLGITRLRGRP